jgi:hypothetical protein
MLEWSSPVRKGRYKATFIPLNFPFFNRDKIKNSSYVKNKVTLIRNVYLRKGRENEEE